MEIEDFLEEFCFECPEEEEMFEEVFLGVDSKLQIRKKKIVLVEDDDVVSAALSIKQKPRALRRRRTRDGVADSGATVLLSRHRDDFVSLEKEANVRVRSANGTVEGCYRGILKDNIYGIRNGVFLEALPVDRLISIPQLQELGWRVIFEAHGSGGVSRVERNGAVIPMYKKGAKLPYIPLFAGDICESAVGDEAIVENVAHFVETGKLPPPSVVYLSALEIHRRNCHIWTPGLRQGRRFFCPECATAKMQTAPNAHDKDRKPEYIAAAPLRSLNTDFWGPVPESIRDKTMVQAVVCDSINKVFIFPIRHKDEVVDNIRTLARKLNARYGTRMGEKVVRSVRSDNEPVLRGEGWTSMLLEIEALEAHSVPRHPQMNSVVERWFRSMAAHLRAMLQNVDQSLWCYAVECLAETHGSTRRQSYPRAPRFDGLAPDEILKIFEARDVVPEAEGIAAALARPEPPRVKHFRRFGSLVFCKIPEPEGKFSDRAVPCVLLGYTANGYRLGTFVKDKRCTTSGLIRWRDDIEAKAEDCRILESLTVGRVEWLKPGSGTVAELLELCGGSAHARNPSPSSSLLKDLVLPGELSTTPATSPTDGTGMASGGGGEGPSVSGGVTDPGTPADTDVVPNLDPVQVTPNDERSNPDDGARKRPREGESPKSEDGGSQVKRKKTDGVTVIPKRRRGRPPGSKDKKPRRRRPTTRKQEAMTFVLYMAFVCAMTEKQKKAEEEDLVKIVEEINDTHGLEMEEGEVMLEVTAYLTLKQALSSPEAPRYIEAIEVEKLKLETFGTWRELTPEELKKLDPRAVLPVVVLVSRKRCGRYKARAVALGNRAPKEADGGLECYSPTVSMAAVRTGLIAAAHAGQAVRFFDISNAFVQCFLPKDMEVNIRLPEQWINRNCGGSVGSSSPYRRLVKSLYGMRVSPRLWHDELRAKLEVLGWTPHQLEPGVYIRDSTKVKGEKCRMYVYVDDCFCTGPSQSECDALVGEVLKVFPGTEIKGERIVREDVSWMRYDVLGMDWWYRRSHCTCRFVCERYIEKMQEIFEMKDAKSATSPSFNESQVVRAALKAEKDGTSLDFNMRKIIGCLQWAATICRPDIQQPISALARLASKPATVEARAAARKILRYLIGSKFEGVRYSPQDEREFERIYSDLLGRKVPDTNIFTDASFASCYISMRSISGAVIYYRGAPICWRSSRQTVRTYSTMSSEWVAASDGLILSESLSFLDFFQRVPGDFVCWVDNLGAIQSAKAGAERPAARHLALRWHRVVDSAKHLAFCPTHLQRADVLTKTDLSPSQRKLVLHVVQSPCSDDIDEDMDEELDACMACACVAL